MKRHRRSLVSARNRIFSSEGVQNHAPVAWFPGTTRRGLPRMHGQSSSPRGINRERNQLTDEPAAVGSVQRSFDRLPMDSIVQHEYAPVC